MSNITRVKNTKLVLLIVYSIFTVLFMLLFNMFNRLQYLYHFHTILDHKLVTSWRFFNISTHNIISSCLSLSTMLKQVFVHNIHVYILCVDMGVCTNPLILCFIAFNKGNCLHSLKDLHVQVIYQNKIPLSNNPYIHPGKHSLLLCQRYFLYFFSLRCLIYYSKGNSKFWFSICNELLMYYGIYELYPGIISDTMHSYITLLFIVTVFIFYNIVLHGISTTNVVCTCSYLNMHNPRLVSTGMEYVYWWRFQTLVILFSIIQIIVHMTLNNVKTQLLSVSHIQIFCCFCSAFFERLYKTPQ